MNFENKASIFIGTASGMGHLFAENFAAIVGNVVMYDLTEEISAERGAAINEKDSGRNAMGRKS